MINKERQNSLRIRLLRADNGGMRERGRRSADTGAAMIEMAVVIVLLVTLLVGTVTAAVAYGRGNSIQNAAREAARYGATLPDGGTSEWFTAVRDVARAAAIGDLDPGVPGQLICIAFITENDAATHVTDVGGVTGGIQGGGCFSDGRSDEARVQVLVERETTLEVVVFSRDVTLSASSAARYERG